MSIPPNIKSPTRDSFFAALRAMNSLQAQLEEIALKSVIQDEEDHAKANLRILKKMRKGHESMMYLSGYIDNKGVPTVLDAHGEDNHTDHCCRNCGCMYGDVKCTVVNSTYRQTYVCGAASVCHGS